MLVLGLGDTGLSMTRWLARQGAVVTAADSRESPPFAATVAAELPKVALETGGFRKESFEDAETIAISPGIDRREPLVAGAIRRGVPVLGDVEMFAQALRRGRAESARAHPKVIGITGSNGKSTATAMTGDISRACGRRTVVAGNIGLPVLDALIEIEDGEPMPDAFVLELSSFQLESTSSLDADAATMLNLTEDHLDRYEGMSEYARAKARVFDGAGVQVLNRDDAWSAAMARAGRVITSFGLDTPAGELQWGLAQNKTWLARGSEALMPVGELPVAGLHNAANALAALALGAAIDLEVSPMLEALRRFRGLPHRLQKIARIRDVTFYDDSKGTNVGATVAALKGSSVPVVLIAGGDGKGQDFSPLAGAVSGRVRAVVLIGRDAPQIHSALSGSGVELVRASTLEDAVELAYRKSRPHDAVLLSPACASYDMFKSYVHRGEVFAHAVHVLAAREEGGTRE